MSHRDRRSDFQARKLKERTPPPPPPAAPVLQDLGDDGLDEFYQSQTLMQLQDINWRGFRQEWGINKK